MLYRFYIYDEQMLFPSVAETEEGFYVDIKPVEKFKVSQIDEWKPVLYRALTTANEIIPTPEQHDEGGSALLEALNLQRWAVFEKKAVMYTIHAGASYTKVYRTGKGPDGMWAPAGTTERVFDRRTPIQYVVDALAEDAIKQPEAHPFKTGGLMVLPKAETSEKSDAAPKLLPRKDDTADDSKSRDPKNSKKKSEPNKNGSSKPE